MWDVEHLLEEGDKDGIAPLRNKISVVGALVPDVFFVPKQYLLQACRINGEDTAVLKCTLA